VLFEGHNAINDTLKMKGKLSSNKSEDEHDSQDQISLYSVVLLFLNSIKQIYIHIRIATILSSKLEKGMPC